MGSSPTPDQKPGSKQVLAVCSISALVQMIMSLGSDVKPMVLSPSPRKNKTGRGHKRTHTLFEKSRGHSSQFCGLC